MDCWLFPKPGPALWYYAAFSPTHGRHALLPCEPLLVAWRHNLVVERTVQHPSALPTSATLPSSSWSTLDPSNLFLARGLHQRFQFLCLSYALLMSWLSRKACCYFQWRLLQVSQPIQFQPNLALSLNVDVGSRFLDDLHRNQKNWGMSSRCGETTRSCFVVAVYLHPHQKKLLPATRHYFFEVNVVQLQQDFMVTKMQIVDCWICTVECLLHTFPK